MSTRCLPTLLLCLVFCLSPAFGWQPVRHAGKVEYVDWDEGLVVVDQLVQKGKHERRVIRVQNDTPIVSVRRPRSWDAYEEVELTLFEVVVGDFVVVESREHDGRLVAQKITVIETDRRVLQRQ